MALVKCRECGHEVSDQAETCPHCGIKNPGLASQPSTRFPKPPPLQPKKKGMGCFPVLGWGFIGLVVLFIVIAVIGGNSSDNQSPNSPQTQTASPGPIASSSSSDDGNSAQNSQGSSTVVFVGNRGQIVGATMGCPDLEDIKTFVNSYVKAQIAKDDVGEGEAIATAVQADCKSFKVGDQGLVIDTQGFLEGYDKIRMDSDASAYWVPREATAPIPGQPNNP